RYAQSSEVACTHALPIKPFGLGLTSQCRLPESHHRGRIKGATALEQFAIGAERNVEARTSVAEVPDGCDPVCLGIRQRLKQNGVHRTEDGGARADAQCEGEDGDQCKAGLLEQHSQSKTYVLDHVVLPSVGL